MKRLRIFVAVPLLLTAIPLAAAPPAPQLERKFVTLTVRISGLPKDTRFRLDARALYRMVDPRSAPRGAKFAVTDDMVRYRLFALRDGTWESTVPAPDRVIEQVFRFEFSEKLLPPAAGERLWAEVVIPVSFAFADPATHLMRPMRPLGSIPIAIESASSSLQRCLTLKAVPNDAVQFRILPSCPD